MSGWKSLFGWGEPEPEPKPACYHIYGFLGCPYFQQAMCVGRELQSDKSKRVSVSINVSPRPSWRDDLKTFAENHGTNRDGHDTCPIIFEGCANSDSRLVGGYSEFSELVFKRHKFRSTRCEK